MSSSLTLPAGRALEEHVLLRDGSSIVVRPLANGDEAAIDSWFEGLSPETRRARFLVPLKRLDRHTRADLAHVDHADNEAITAVDPDGDTIGIARYIRMRPDPHAAEVAVAVADRWRGRGVASLLLERLRTRAKQAGIHELTALCLASNDAVIRLLSTLGPTTIDDPGDGLVELRIELIGPAEPLDLEAVDSAVEAAVRAGEPGALRVLGYGEITLVLGWPSERPTLAVKRLPVFNDRAQLTRYRVLLHEYITELGRRGVSVLPTELRSTNAGRPHVYLAQPLVPRENMLNRILASAETAPERGAALLGRVVAAVADTVDQRVGLDAQVANWAVDADRLSCLDLSTPLMRSRDGHDLLDLDLFLSIYPWALRPALRRIAHDVMGQYHEPREVIVDVASNLVKERLERWLPALLEAANERVEQPITEREVRKYFARDKQLWLLMQRLRRADRAWQRLVRRRPYPFLLPPPYLYGPPELPEGDAP